MDFASFVGIISGVALIVSAIILGGDVHNFINIPGLMIVVGGTMATTLLTFQFKDYPQSSQQSEKTSPQPTTKTPIGFGILLISIAIACLFINKGTK